MPSDCPGVLTEEYALFFRQRPAANATLSYLFGCAGKAGTVVGALAPVGCVVENQKGLHGVLRSLGDWQTS